ncbi:inactive peptidyl-prolyl cis-trans isomerase FKBP6-like protein, partial [Leptotrombidium deliense]
SNDELLEYLKQSPDENPDPMLPMNSQFADFDELIKHMKPIFEDKVYKRTLRKGVGDLVTQDTSVSYHCQAFFDGHMEPFDSSVLRGKPFLSRLNYDLIVPGLLAGLITMRQFERAEFLVRPEMGYGSIGCPPRIPANATILYKVEILKIFSEGSLANYEAMTLEERQRLTPEQILKVCDEERNSGNSYYNAKKFKEAAFRYRKAIQVLEPFVYNNQLKSEDVIGVLLKLYSNAANVYNKIEKPKVAINFCDRVLKLDPNNVKAFYHKAVAKRILGDTESARDLLLKAKKLSPENEDIVKEMKKLEQRMQMDDESERQLFTRMAACFRSKN